jgi:DNA polymerase I-like protein with 3'-5' exonuclease and polymerase domains
MILWLTSKSGYSPGIRQILTATIARQGIRASSIIYNSLHYKAPLLAEHDKNKMPDKFAIAQALKVLDAEIEQLKPTLIVINDESTLRAITGSKYTLSTVRGSLYFYRSVPAIVIDGFNSIRFKKYGKFVFELDLAKIARWAKGEQNNEPAFDYTVCKTVDEVVAEVEAAKNSTVVATDTETTGGFISCVSYTYDTPDRRLRTFVVPFFDPWCEEGAYWAEEVDETKVREKLKELNEASVVKIMQNGSYDCAYFIKEGMPPVNYLIDTQLLMHSMWIEAPKKLHNIASYFVDHYTYWKDENKGVREDGFGKTHEAIEKYWRYNGLDSYNTWLGAQELLKRIVVLPWALYNYSERIALSNGPLLAASLRGIKVDRNRHDIIMREQGILAEKGKLDLQRLSGEPDFNVNSPNDVAWLLYDVLGAKPTRLQRKGTKLGPRSTDEKVLKLMKEQRNFFVSHAIDRILKAKKPAAVLSKYGDMRELCYKDDRFLSWHNAAGTETYRLNSGSSQFWTGTNAQNLQPFIQEMFTADKDYVFLDADFSASDDWFIAHEAQDEAKIAILKSGRDVHCTHASVFFKRPYDEIYAGYKNKEEWVIHPITGVRQASKKIAHGKNFRMQATMMYNLMGRDAAVETARALGYKNPERLDDKELIGMCNMLCDMYDHPRTGMYKRIRPWQDETVEELKKNDGLATNAFGFTRNFFGSADDHATQRELSAYFGQSGTASNANRSLREIFYNSVDDGRTCLFLVQVHDSLKFLVHRNCMSTKISQIKKIMEKEITLKGRSFHVPVNLEVGLTDGKKMIPWRDDLTYEEIVEHEHKTYDKRFPKGTAALLASLEAINFDETTLDNLEEQLETDHSEEMEDVD